MIEAHGLSKSYGTTRAVDGISFTVRPGIVTGFLGPNG
ncbi:MAG: ABC transporter ATP-binding protein, partial [Cellulomonas sp.]|nr:ABC transporter ATP-binding protein [Cellulomonas sp.]